MLKLNKKLSSDIAANVQLSLSYEQRVKSRLRVTLSDGREAGLDLPRGDVLRHGDVLCSDGGEHVRVVAAPETLSVVRTSDALLRARICYHLGNRHTAIEINSIFISYQHDHVLDAMVVGLGAQVSVEELGFEPEAGAYSAHGQYAH
ncbi:MAG: urease accessory protein UreE [Gammaproteobacteria bacterium]|jgi:urease accessory protein|nr:urease accessory protein UreE [Gammaproteobacteria bacterium]